jgi:competence protein ComEA
MRFNLFAATVFAFVLALTSATAARPVAVAAGELPPGPGRETLVRVCSDCHGVDLIEGQRRTRAQWKELVDDMVARGANSSDDDARTIINYLATLLGRVNVNKASEADIKTTLEVSETEAAAIVNYRTTSGEFKNFDDLKKVPGLDVSKLEPRKDRMTFAGQ